jgi:hypothetical protein
MDVIDISSKLFTVNDKKELTDTLRALTHQHDLKEEELTGLKARAKILLEKAGGAEKFFKNADSTLKHILT